MHNDEPMAILVGDDLAEIWNAAPGPSTSAKTQSPRLVFLGESPPPGAGPDFRPFNCESGSRLARAIGLRDRATLLQKLTFRNCFDAPGTGTPGGPRWDVRAAEDGAGLAVACLLRGYHLVVVALGRRPAVAIGLGETPPWGVWLRRRDVGIDVVALPHPSGRSPEYNDPHRRRHVAQCVLPEIVAAVDSLRPWDFDLTRDAVLLDLGAAVCPLDVALGVACVRVACEMRAVQAAPRGVSLRALQDIGDVPLSLLVRTMTQAPKVLLEVKRRAVAARRTDGVADYPAAVLRATIGRYAALGVEVGR